VYWRGQMWIYVHVDDIAIFSKNPEIFKDELDKRFNIKDFGPAKLLLGMNISFPNSNSISLSQSHYIEQTLERFNLKDITPSPTPLYSKVYLFKASKEERKQFNDLNINYRSAVGVLNSISVTTRPDITFAVSSLSKFLTEPGINHWKACLKTFTYLKYTKHYSLTISKNSSINSISDFTDADWASCHQTRR